MELEAYNQWEGVTDQAIANSLRTTQKDMDSIENELRKRGYSIARICTWKDNPDWAEVEHTIVNIHRNINI